MAEFAPERLREALAELPPARSYWVGYSGGMDSHVLLHALARLDVAPVRALHVDHGLLPQAAAWTAHCREVCTDLGVDCRVLAVDARPHPRESPEAAARRARYQALAEVLGADEILLTGHHREDQVETLLLHLLRGSGPHGLAGMPPFRRLGAGWLGRPLLGWARDDLRSYARSHGLEWVEDPSNRDPAYPRNYLRHEVLPLLTARWPALGRVVTRAASHQAEAARLLDGLAAEDLARGRGERPNTLDVPTLRAMGPERCQNLLRYWIRTLDLSPPGQAHLEEAWRALAAPPDAVPVVRWPGAELRRYRGELHAMANLPDLPEGRPLPWRPPAALALPWGRLLASRARGTGLRVASCGEEVEVRLRRGGERLRPAGRAHTRSLKKLLQAQGIAPWERRYLPLVYVNDELAAVADLWLSARYAAGPDEVGWALHWERGGPLRTGPVSGRREDDLR